MEAESAFSAVCPCSEGSLLTFEWGIGTELILCELRSESGIGGINPYISSVVWSAPSASHKTLAHALIPQQRDLVFSSQTGTDEGRNRLRKFSSTVREALDKERRSPDADGGTSSIISLEHSLWHLLEVFFVDASQSEGYIAEDLVAWLRSTGHTIDDLTGRPSLDARLQAVLSGHNLEDQVGAMDEGSDRVPSDSLSDYWPLVAHLVCVGRIQDALSLLLAHSAMSNSQQTHGPQHELIDALYVLLRQMPIFRLSSSSSSSGQSQVTGREFDNMSEFVQYRSQWQNQCRRLPDQCPDLFAACQSSSPSTFDGILTVLEVLGSGEEVPLLSFCSNWVELLVAHLIHLRPNAQARHHLKSLLTRCRQVKPEAQDTEDPAASAILPMLGDLLEALIDLEVQRVVEVLSSSGAVSPWFMAHMYEIMKAAPRAQETIGRTLDLFGGDQVEYWRLMVAEMMASQPSTTWLAIDYLALCPIHGAEATEIILESLPLKSGGGGFEGREKNISTRQVNKILHSASVHGLGSSAASVCRSVGARAWYSSKGDVVGEAALWMMRAGDGRRLAAVLRPAVLDALLSSVSLGKGLGVSDADMEASTTRRLEELEALVASLSPPSLLSSISTNGADLGLSHHTVTRFLRGFLKLRRSVETMASLHSSLLQVGGGENVAQAKEVEGAALDVAREARMALIDDLLGSSDGKGCVVPQDIAMHLLSWLVVPLFELVAKMSSSQECNTETRGALFALFTTQDIQSLIKWSLEVDLGAKRSKLLLPAVQLRAKEIEEIKAEGVKEVKICLAKALTRSRISV